jgi:hypothetical protein
MREIASAGAAARLGTLADEPASYMFLGFNNLHYHYRGYGYTSIMVVVPRRYAREAQDVFYVPDGPLMLIRRLLPSDLAEYLVHSLTQPGTTEVFNPSTYQMTHLAGQFEGDRHLCRIIAQRDI